MPRNVALSMLVLFKAFIILLISSGTLTPTNDNLSPATPPPLLTALAIYVFFGHFFFVYIRFVYFSELRIYKYTSVFQSALLQPNGRCDMRPFLVHFPFHTWPDDMHSLPRLPRRASSTTTNALGLSLRGNMVVVYQLIVWSRCQMWRWSNPITLWCRAEVFTR